MVVACHKGENRHLQGSLDSTMAKEPHDPIAPPFLPPMGHHIKVHGVLKCYWSSIMVFDQRLVRVMGYLYGSLYEGRDTVLC